MGGVLLFAATRIYHNYMLSDHLENKLVCKSCAKVYVQILIAYARCSFDSTARISHGINWGYKNELLK